MKKLTTSWLVFLLGAAACANDLSSDDVASVEESLTQCKSAKPTVTECQTLTCDVESKTWLVENLPAGETCGGGTCNGSGACILTNPPSPPSAPANLRISASTPSSLTFAWSASARVDRYQVVLSNGASTTTVGTSALVDGLLDGFTYCVTVTAVNRAGSASSQLCGTTPFAPGTVVTTIRNEASGMCLAVLPSVDDPTNFFINGLFVAQAPCDASLEQSWSIQYEGPPPALTGGSDVYHVLNRRSGKCMDLTDGQLTDGNHIQQWDCVDSTSMAWFTRDLTSAVFRHLSVARSDDDSAIGSKCLAIRDGSLSAEIDACVASAAQRFQFTIQN